MISLHVDKLEMMRIAQPEDMRPFFKLLAQSECDDTPKQVQDQQAHCA